MPPDVQKAFDLPKSPQGSSSPASLQGSRLHNRAERITAKCDCFRNGTTISAGTRDELSVLGRAVILFRELLSVR
jgi:hypothetical protein